MGHPGGRVGQINRRIVETAADAFLNWVRDSFQDDDDGAAWEQFFDTYIGVFLRNAVVYNNGNVDFYKAQGLIPEDPFTGNISDFGSTYRVRMLPLASPDNEFGRVQDHLPMLGVEIYGWDINESEPAVQNTYWVLVSTNENWLFWVGSRALDDDDAVKNLSEFDEILTSPARPYLGSGIDDLAFIIGEK